MGGRGERLSTCGGVTNDPDRSNRSIRDYAPREIPVDPAAIDSLGRGVRVDAAKALRIRLAFDAAVQSAARSRSGTTATPSANDAGDTKYGSTISTTHRRAA